MHADAMQVYVCRYTDKYHIIQKKLDKYYLKLRKTAPNTSQILAQIKKKKDTVGGFHLQISRKS